MFRKHKGSDWQNDIAVGLVWPPADATVRPDPDDPALPIKPHDVAVNWNQRLAGGWWTGDPAPGMMMLCLVFPDQRFMLTEGQVLYALLTHRMDGLMLSTEAVKILWNAYAQMRVTVRSDTYWPHSYASFIRDAAEHVYPPLGWFLGQPVSTTQNWFRDSGAFPPPSELYIFGGATYFKGGLAWGSNTRSREDQIDLLLRTGWLDLHAEWFTGSAANHADTGLRDIEHQMDWAADYSK